MPFSNSIEGASLNELITQYQMHRNDPHEAERFKTFAKEGQAPQVMVIACADSRVDPAMILGCAPGDLFVVRNVANLVPPYQSDKQHHGTSAALEFAVLELGVKDVVVLGHSHCGGIRALMMRDDHHETTDFIDAWMDIAQTAKDTVIEKHPSDDLNQLAHHCEQASLLISLKNLRTFPWIQKRIQAKQLTLHGWYFDIAQNSLMAFNPGQAAFAPVTVL